MSSLVTFYLLLLGWAAIPFSRGSSWPRDQSQVSCTADGVFTVWATREASNCCSRSQHGNSLLQEKNWGWKAELEMNQSDKNCCVQNYTPTPIWNKLAYIPPVFPPKEKFLPLLPRSVLVLHVNKSLLVYLCSPDAPGVQTESFIIYSPEL